MSSSESAKVVPKRVQMPTVVSTSWSVIDGEKKASIFAAEIKHQHVCRITNIREKIKMEPGTELRSEPFSILIQDKKIDWCLKICPNENVSTGNRNQTQKYIGVYLEKITDTEFPIEAYVVLNSLDSNGTTTKLAGSNNVIFKDEKCWGLTTFKAHSSLLYIIYGGENPKSESLTVVCDIKIKGSKVNVVTNGSTSIPSPEDITGISKFMEDMGNIFEAGKFTDVTIVCQDREFECHKAILAARSTVLEAMFSHNMKEERDSKVEIQDMDKDILRKMIVFMYSGKVAGLDGKAADLLVAAEKYDLKELKRMCEDKLCVNLNLDNALDMLVLADLHGANNLRLITLEFIGENGKKIITKEGWREKVKMYPDLMADMIVAMFN